MIAIVDAGGTSCTWVVLDGKDKQRFLVSGFNPLYDKKPKIPVLNDPKGLKHLYFYGAGIFSKALADEIKSGLQKTFPKTELHVFSDLLGASRSLLQDREGWVGILGTGSALVNYNGKEVNVPKPSLGYLLGDEGSGFDLGKRILKHYLRRELPNAVQSRMSSKLEGMNPISVIQHHSRPASYIASFASVIIEQKDDSFCQSLINKAFRSYFEAFSPENLKELSFIGSIAFHLSTELKEIAAGFDIDIQSISKSPVEGLVEYHENVDKSE